MRHAARCLAKDLFRALPIGLGVVACSVYEPELLDESSDAVRGGNGGSSAGSNGDTTAGKPAGAGKGGSQVIPSGGTGSPSDETGGAGEPDAGSAGSTTGTAGSGGEPPTSGGGSIGGSAGAGGGPVTLPGDLLDGFEDEDITLEESGGRGGVWYLFDDGTVGEVGPAPLVVSPLVDALPALGRYALHITASGFTGYGSGLGVDFRAGKKPYDGSKLSGVRFWARVGEGKNTRHRLQLVDATTDKLGGKCNPALDAPEGEKCDDHFGKNLILTSTWTHYEVPFADLSQIGWGQAAAALDKATLYGLQLTAKPKLEVDLWLDQIEFF